MSGANMVMMAPHLRIEPLQVYVQVRRVFPEETGWSPVCKKGDACCQLDCTGWHPNDLRSDHVLFSEFPQCRVESFTYVSLCLGPGIYPHKRGTWVTLKNLHMSLAYLPLVDVFSACRMQDGFNNTVQRYFQTEPLQRPDELSFARRYWTTEGSDGSKFPSELYDRKFDIAPLTWIDVEAMWERGALYLHSRGCPAIEDRKAMRCTHDHWHPRYVDHYAAAKGIAGMTPENHQYAWTQLGAVPMDFNTGLGGITLQCDAGNRQIFDLAEYLLDHIGKHRPRKWTNWVDGKHKIHCTDSLHVTWCSTNHLCKKPIEIPFTHGGRT